jgi:hypothetical protein
MTNHPIIPPPELVEDWAYLFVDHTDTEVFSAVAQWGADQELEACCEWLQDPDLNVDTYKLRVARRPKPPSLKEQALAALNEIEDEMLGPTIQEKLIRRALEALPE